jgi:hypothetical protein
MRRSPAPRLRGALGCRRCSGLGSREIAVGELDVKAMLGEALDERRGSDDLFGHPDAGVANFVVAEGAQDLGGADGGCMSFPTADEAGVCYTASSVRSHDERELVAIRVPLPDFCEERRHR